MQLRLIQSLLCPKIVQEFHSPSVCSVSVEMILAKLVVKLKSYMKLKSTKTSVLQKSKFIVITDLALVHPFRNPN